ncbi:nucleoside hydrolase-like domain-containing protein [Algoriphagus sp.]|uniref:nucleoside hydrolase-like domain-containing protein n=1 Tax=Algoriphagus sp. TaxID=1872435 RepID=UPI00391CDB51
MKKHLLFTILLLFRFSSSTFCQDRIPVIVSTDIGGDDPDDHQSLIHFLLYANRFEVLGIISSPPGKGRLSDIEEVIEAYERDFPKLKASGLDYPSPIQLINVSKQGEIEIQKTEMPERLSTGAEFMAKQILDYGKPVYVLIWGSITDLAQAVHYFPEIKPLIRVYSIGSWNTQQDQKSRDYLWNNHPDFWWIENNTTFRGMYMGGIQEDPWENISFVETSVKDFGALGKLFFEKKPDIKMGDTPSVLYLLNGNPENPEGENWGGSFIKSPDRMNYWTDRQEPELIENNRPGAKTVNRYRLEYLKDWKERMKLLR